MGSPVHDIDILQAGFVAQRLRQMALSYPGGSDEEQVTALLNERAGCQLLMVGLWICLLKEKSKLAMVFSGFSPERRRAR
jgi:hypothetical protein